MQNFSVNKVPGSGVRSQRDGSATRPEKLQPNSNEYSVKAYLKNMVIEQSDMNNNYQVYLQGASTNDQKIIQNKKSGV